MTMSARRTVDDLFRDACSRVDCLSPEEAHAETEVGAVIVDIRTPDNRRRDGIVPGSVHIERTVLEWRVDPDCTWHNPYLGGVEQRLIVMCDHGYSSALAAASLGDLGLVRPAHLVGGFEAWREAGLPVRSCPAGPTPGLPGSGPPD
jgi:rhodanese-related sulfurtransferase